MQGTTFEQLNNVKPWTDVKFYRVSPDQLSHWNL